MAGGTACLNAKRRRGRGQCRHAHERAGRGGIDTLDPSEQNLSSLDVSWAETARENLRAAGLGAHEQATSRREVGKMHDEPGLLLDRSLPTAVALFLLIFVLVALGVLASVDELLAELVSAAQDDEDEEREEEEAAAEAANQLEEGAFATPPSPRAGLQGTRRANAACTTAAGQAGADDDDGGRRAASPCLRGPRSHGERAILPAQDADEGRLR